jgi:hypothetical protein
MPLNQTALHSFLSGKLQFESRHSRHIKYELPPHIRTFIPGVFPIHLQHGRGDVSDHIIKQIANFFGLSIPNFSIARKCDYSERAIFYSMLVSQIDRIARLVEREPIVFSRNLLVYAQGMVPLLATINRIFDAVLHKRDGDILAELRTNLLEIRSRKVISQHSDRAVITSAIDALLAAITALRH